MVDGNALAEELFQVVVARVGEFLSPNVVLNVMMEGGGEKKASIGQTQRWQVPAHVLSC